MTLCTSLKIAFEGIGLAIKKTTNVTTFAERRNTSTAYHLHQQQKYLDYLLPMNAKTYHDLSLYCFYRVVCYRSWEQLDLQTGIELGSFSCEIILTSLWAVSSVKQCWWAGENLLKPLNGKSKWSSFRKAFCHPGSPSLEMLYSWWDEYCVAWEHVLPHRGEESHRYRGLEVRISEKPSVSCCASA